MVVPFPLSLVFHNITIIGCVDYSFIMHFNCSKSSIPFFRREQELVAQLQSEKQKALIESVIEID